MSEEELIEKIKEMCEFFEIEKLYKIEYKRQDKKGKNKFKIKYIKKGIPNIMIEKIITEN